ncbi:MAG: hypothetical protein AAGM38_04680 [Pseudomonadota bacterium]
MNWNSVRARIGDHLLGIAAGIALFSVSIALILVSVATTLIPGVRGQGSGSIFEAAYRLAKRAGVLIGGGYEHSKSCSLI